MNKNIKKTIIGILILLSVLLVSCGNKEPEYVNNSDGTITLDNFQDINKEEFIVPESYDGTIVTSIGKNCFRNNETIEKITLPESIKTIEANAFNGCINLKEINLPNGLEKIDVSAFMDTNLEKVIIPSSTKFIGMAAFAGCKNLKELVISNTLETIEDSAFGSCTNLQKVTIPGSIKKMGQCIFSNCTSLKEVVIEEGLTTMGYGIFEFCDSLETISIPDSVTTIEANAFSNCINLKNVKLSNNLQSISSNMFSSCGSLTTIEIPNSVTSIESHAFSDCDNLIEITIPDNVTKIGREVFYGCDNLEKINIGKKVNEIGLYTFYNCPALKEINVSDNNSIFSSIDGVLFNKPKTILMIYPKAKNDNTYIVPSTVVEIANRAFYGNTSLVNITISSNVVGIGEQALAFTKINAITLPKSLINLDLTAFEGCDDLKEIKVEEGNPDYQSIDGNLYAYGTILAKYASGKNEKTFEIPEGVTSLLYWYHSMGNCPTLETVYLPETIENVSCEFFEGCPALKYNEYQGGYYLGSKNNPYLVLMYINNKDLTTYNIHKDTKMIVRNTFKDCVNLTEITLPSNLKFIGEGAFDGCISLKKIDIPSSVTYIYDWAFRGCTSLTTITLPEGLTIVERQIVSGCTSLKEINLPSSIQIIFEYAFENCTALEKINYNDTKDRWSAVQKIKDWDQNTGNYVVNCK